MTMWVCYGRSSLGVHTLYSDYNPVMVRLERDYWMELMDLGETEYYEVWVQAEKSG